MKIEKHSIARNLAVNSIAGKITLLVLGIVILFVLGNIIDIFLSQRNARETEKLTNLLSADGEIVAVHKQCEKNREAVQNYLNNQGDESGSAILASFSAEHESINNLRTNLAGDSNLSNTLNDLEDRLNQEEAYVKNVVIPAGSVSDATQSNQVMGGFDRLHIQETALAEGLLGGVELSLSTWRDEHESFMMASDFNKALVSVIATIIGIVAGLLISRKIGKRLKRLEDSVTRVSRGDLKQRVEITGSDEVARLSRAFNEMASSIQTGNEELTREQNRIRSVHQAIADGLVVYDQEGRITSVNPAAEAALDRLESELAGGRAVGIEEVDAIMGETDLVPEEQKVHCWIEKKCTHPECPSYESSDLRCWLQCGTSCHNEIQGTFSQKRDACERCDVYSKNGIRNCEFSRKDQAYSVWISPVLDDLGHEQGRMVVIHDVTYMRAAQESLQVRNRELTVINEIASLLTQSLDDTDVVFDEVLTRITAAIDVRGGAIILLERDRSSMQLKAYKGISSHTALLFHLLDLTDEIKRAEDNWADVISAEDLARRHKSIAPTLKKEGFQGNLVVPLWAKGNIVGVMMLFDDTGKSYNEDDMRLIAALAAQIGVAVQNAELFRNVAKAKKAWETTFDSMNDGVSVHDTENNIVRANRSIARMLDTSIDELVGKKCYEVIHGRTSPIAICPQKEVLATGNSVSIEIEEPTLDKTFRLSMNPVKDGNGKVIGLVHVLRDITERKQLREQLLQSEKMAAVGQLVSGVAHELNNPLTGVMGYSQLLLRRCDDGGMKDIEKDLTSIYGEAQRASRIVQNLLSFARKHQPQKSLIDLNEAIRTVLELRAYELNVTNIEIITDLNPGLPNVLADLHQIEQVLLNIVNNAEQAIEAAHHSGKISIKTSCEAGIVTLCVTDNGAGIAAENLQRIFDPFFTTKEVGKGTGLGLSICYGIIEEHGGEIRVDSKADIGTSITIELPAADGALAGKIISDPPATAVDADSGKRVLVVDDEPAIVDLLTDILTMAGYGVDVARDGVSALKKLAGANYNNIITDVRMPEMDGTELHRRIREIDPGLAANVIFMTGDTLSSDTREYLDNTGNMYLAKPFNLHELRETLNKVMSKNG